MAKQIAFIRHGEETHDWNTLKEILMNSGVTTLKMTSAHLNTFFENKKGIIICGEKPRNTLSAEVIYNEMPIDEKPVKCKFMETSYYELVDSDNGLFDKLRKLNDNYDYAVVISHRPDIETHCEIYNWSGVNKSPPNASGHIIKIDDWSKVTPDGMKKAKIIANFTPQKLTPL